MKEVAAFITAILITAYASAQENTYAERLGWPTGSKVVIFHVDDGGMSHDSNMGMLEAMTKGVATSTSVMYPCPWVAEAAKIFKEHPDLDIGVHATLTSEWNEYRWGPVAGKSAVPGLTDNEGCLWKSVMQVASHATPDEFEAELRAQVDRAFAVGIPPTHIDTHMGTVFATPQFFERYMKVGIEKHIPLMIPAGHNTRLQQSREGGSGQAEAVRKAGEQAWAAGLPVLDDLETGGMKNKGPEFKKQHIIEFLQTLKPGITQYIVHCTRPTETFKSISSSGDMRLAELNAMLDPEVAKVIKDQKIILTTWRELKQKRDAVK